MGRRQGLLWALSITALLGLGELALRARYRQRVLPAGRVRAGAIMIVALGDSITAGWPGSPDQAWPALLAERLRIAYPTAAWRVANAGAPGNTAPLGYARFDQDVAAYAPDAVLIAFGLNDCHRACHALDRWFEARRAGRRGTQLCVAGLTGAQRTDRSPIARARLRGVRVCARTDAPAFPADVTGGILGRALGTDRPDAGYSGEASLTNHDTFGGADTARRAHTLRSVLRL